MMIWRKRLTDLINNSATEVFVEPVLIGKIYLNPGSLNARIAGRIPNPRMQTMNQTKARLCTNK